MYIKIRNDNRDVILSTYQEKSQTLVDERIVLDNATKANIHLTSGDVLTITYETPDRQSHEFTIHAEHLVLLINHTDTDAALIVRPSVGVQFIPGNPNPKTKI